MERLAAGRNELRESANARGRELRSMVMKSGRRENDGQRNGEGRNRRMGESEVLSPGRSATDGECIKAKK